MDDHYAEVARLKQVLGPPEMDVEKYQILQSQGSLVFVAAYCNHPDDGYQEFMVGYVFVVLTQHPHYKSVTVAVDDMHYLAPEYRNGLVGMNMLKFAEAAAARRGAKVFTMRCKAHLNHGRIFERMGYELSDLVYVKDLTNAL